MARFFISHSFKDKPLVDLFYTLLKQGMDIPDKELFCSSLDGKIPPGTKFRDHIKKNLDDATTVMAIVSLNFNNSRFCAYEMGAAWMGTTLFIPVVVPPLTHEAVDPIFEGIQATQIDDENQLDNLASAILSKRPDLNIATWNRQKKSFLESLHSLLPNQDSLSKRVTSRRSLPETSIPEITREVLRRGSFSELGRSIEEDVPSERVVSRKRRRKITFDPDGEPR